MELCVEVNHGAMIDNGLVFFVVCAMLALDRLREPNGANGILFVLLFYVALAGAFLCKGFVGPVLIMAAAGVYRLIARDRSFLPRLRPALGFVVLALLIGPYLFFLWQRGGAEYFNILFVQNHLRRFTGEEGPSGSLFYYVPHLFASTLPWCLLLPPSLWAVWRNWPGYHPNRKRAWLFDCGWVIGMFALLSIAGSKDNQYLLPLLPPIAVLFGDWAQESGGMNVLPRWAFVFHWLFGAVILLVLISLPWLSVWTGQAARPGALLVAAVVAAFVGRAMLALARSDFRLWWKRLLWLPALAGLGLPFFVEAPLNVSKSIRPLSIILDGIYCRDNRLFAYDPSENTIGALVFYGWRPVPINDNLHLAKLAREPEPAMVMIQSMDGTHPIIDDLLSAGAWFFASSAEVGDRVFVFLKNRAAADVLKDQP